MKIHILRKEKNLTQTQLAEACETTQQQIAKIERGVVDPKLSTLMKIAKSLHVEIGELFFTRTEFLRLLNDLIIEEGLTSKRIALATLNSLASEIKKIPPYHPFWEEIEIKNNRVFFMEENDV